MDRWLARVTLMLTVTKSISDAAGFAPLKGASEAVVTLLESIQAVKDNSSAWSGLLRTVRENVAAFQQQLDQLGINDVLDDYENHIKGPINTYRATLTELVAKICTDSGLDESTLETNVSWKILAQRIGTSKLEANTIAGYEKRLKDAEGQIIRALIVYVTISVNASADADILNKLPCQEYTRPRECQRGTRMEVLDECVAWCRDPGVSNILWIKAVPGAGKSTIASSLVRILGIKKQRLGSCFFFRRQTSTVTTPRALWQSVAYDLARHPTIRKHLAVKLREGQIDLTTPNIDELFYELIEEPLSMISIGSMEQSPVVIIDALDECGGIDRSRSKEHQDLLHTITAWSRLSPTYKLIVTSREEDDIAKVFAPSLPYTIDLLVGREKSEQSKRDIQALLKEELRVIANKYTMLPSDWPGPVIVESLALKANGLFIWASTVVEYIRGGDPERLLEEILHTKSITGLSALYDKVLHVALPNVKEDTLQDVCKILGTVLVAMKPLDLLTVSKLLSMKPFTVEYICTALRPVLEMDGGLRFRHQSFVDYLLEPKTEQSQIHLDIFASHQLVAKQCLQTMSDELKFNICHISSSNIFNDEIWNSGSHIQHIPLHLEYASRYWAHHLDDGTTAEGIMTLVRHVLSVKFLSWLEVASLYRFVDEVPYILFILIAWLKANGGSDLIPLAMDMRQFIAHFNDAISRSVPHIYVSALPLSPPSSAVRKQYEKQYPNTLMVTAGGYQRWSPLVATLRGHTGRVTAVVFLPDNSRIVSGSEDMTLLLWDAETGKQIGEPLEGHTEGVSSVAVSPDGHLFASGSFDNTVRLWDAETGKEIGHPLEGHTHWVRSVAFSPDGRMVASGSHDCTVRLWNVETGSQIGHPLWGHNEYISSISFSPDGHFLVSCGPTIILWDVKTRRPIGQPFYDDGVNISSVAFSPDGSQLVSALSDYTVRLWDVEAAVQIGQPLEGHESLISSVAFSPDGLHVASASSDRTVQLWNVETGRRIGRPLKGHTGWVSSVAFSPDGQFVVSGSWDNSVRLWDVNVGGKLEGPLEGHTNWVTSVAFSPDGRLLVSSSDDSTIQLWDVETGRQVGQPPREHRRSAPSVAFSPDGRHLASDSSDDAIWLWDVQTKSQVGDPFRGHTSSIASIAFSPDGLLVVSASNDGTVRLWNVALGSQIGDSLKRGSGVTNNIYWVAFSPDGRRIVSVLGRESIWLWDVEDGRRIEKPLEGHQDQLSSVALSPDGCVLASGSIDMTVRLWDVETGRQIGEPLLGHTGFVVSVAFSPDGRHIASGSYDQTLRLWDVESRKQIGKPLEGHTDNVFSVSFSPNGRFVASGSRDHTVRLWDITDQSVMNSVPNCHCTINKDGWMTDPDGDLMFWIPLHLRTGLVRAGVRIIGQCERLEVDTSKLLQGNNWGRLNESGKGVDGF